MQVHFTAGTLCSRYPVRQVLFDSRYSLQQVHFAVSGTRKCLALSTRKHQVLSTREYEAHSTREYQAPSTRKYKVPSTRKHRVLMPYSQVPSTQYSRVPTAQYTQVPSTQYSQALDAEEWTYEPFPYGCGHKRNTVCWWRVLRGPRAKGGRSSPARERRCCHEKSARCSQTSAR